jgi:hypothetical protein
MQDESSMRPASNAASDRFGTSLRCDRECPLSMKLENSGEGSEVAV